MSQVPLRAPARVLKGNAEPATVDARIEVLFEGQRGLIARAQLTRDIQAKPRALVAGCEKRLEHPLALLCGYTSAVILDIQIRAPIVFGNARADPYPGRITGVL
jgi:hypothetical protein